EPVARRGGCRDVVECRPADLVAAGHGTAARERIAADARRAWEVVEDARRRANGRLPVTVHVPCDAGARRPDEVREMEIRSRLLTGDTAGDDAVQLIARAGHDVAVERRRQEHGRERRIDAPLQVGWTSLI